MSKVSKQQAKHGTYKPAMAIEVMQQYADDAVAVLKALGSRNRLLLLCQLVDGERAVNDLAEVLDLPQSVVSQHLSLLRRDGLVTGRRDGQSIYYAISDQRVHALMAKLFELYCADT